MIRLFSSVNAMMCFSFYFFFFFIQFFLYMCLKYVQIWECVWYMYFISFVVGILWITICKGRKILSIFYKPFYNLLLFCINSNGSVLNTCFKYHIFFCLFYSVSTALYRSQKWWMKIEAPHIVQNQSLL